MPAPHGSATLAGDRAVTYYVVTRPQRVGFIVMNANRCIATLIMLACLGPVFAATCGGHGTRESLFVSTGWLAEHLRAATL